MDKDAGRSGVEIMPRSPTRKKSPFEPVHFAILRPLKQPMNMKKKLLLEK
jgi:hypothetical protein